MLDMGPYYVSNLVQMLGPVKRVAALANTPRQSRTIECEPRMGESIPVDTPTSITALLDFVSGAQITLMTSWDVRAHEHNCMELYGSKGSLILPDPNFFGGEVRVIDGAAERTLDSDHPLDTPNDLQDDDQILANYRGAGVADMIEAIGERGEFVECSTSCSRPEALDASSARSLLS